MGTMLRMNAKPARTAKPLKQGRTLDSPLYQVAEKALSRSRTAFAGACATRVINNSFQQPAIDASRHGRFHAESQVTE
jgi:hypothetical protein